MWRSARASMRGASSACGSACQHCAARAQAGCADVSAHCAASIARLSRTRCVDCAASVGAVARVDASSSCCAASRTRRCDSMRSWPARFIASAQRAASQTARDSSPMRRFTLIAAPRSSRKASSSPSPRADISTPLARSTHLRSSSCSCARAAARRSACVVAVAGARQRQRGLDVGRGDRAVGRRAAAPASGGCRTRPRARRRPRRQRRRRRQQQHAQRRVAVPARQRRDEFGRERRRPGRRAATAIRVMVRCTNLWPSHAAPRCTPERASAARHAASAAVVRSSSRAEDMVLARRSVGWRRLAGRPATLARSVPRKFRHGACMRKERGATKHRPSSARGPQAAVRDASARLDVAAHPDASRIGLRRLSVAVARTRSARARPPPLVHRPAVARSVGVAVVVPLHRMKPP